MFKRLFKMLSFTVVNALSYFTGMPLELEETNISTKHNRLKILTGGRQTYWLFTSVTEELNQNLSRNNSGLVVRAGLEPATSAFKSGALTTQPR